MHKYLVGGCVRDEILGLELKDRDWVVVGSSVDEMLAAGFQQVGRDFPVFLHPTSKEEYALARTERKSGKGYHGFSCYTAKDVTLEQDLARRDLTINAIAKAENGELIDPYGGVEDIQAKVLRHVSPAFSEDPLRVLRVARFAARFAGLGFSIAAETMQLMQQMVATGELETLTAERVWAEMQRALTESNPEVFFTTLRECAALAVVFPALDKLWGVPQRADYHPEVDTGVHTMLSLQQAVKFSNKPELRFAVLCHDLGKALTPPDKWPSHHGHEMLGVKPIMQWCNQYRVPNSYRDLAVKVAKWHLHAHRVRELKPETILKLFNGLDVFRNPTILQDYIIACKADATGRLGLSDKAYPQAELLQAAYEAAVGVDIVPLREQGLEGEQLGRALSLARIAAIKQSFVGN